MTTGTSSIHNASRDDATSPLTVDSSQTSTVVCTTPAIPCTIQTRVEDEPSGVYYNGKALQKPQLLPLQHLVAGKEVNSPFTIIPKRAATPLPPGRPLMPAPKLATKIMPAVVHKSVKHRSPLRTLDSLSKVLVHPDLSHKLATVHGGAVPKVLPMNQAIAYSTMLSLPKHPPSPGYYAATMATAQELMSAKLLASQYKIMPSAKAGLV